MMGWVFFKRKRKLEFSWTKTSLVLFVFLAIVLLGITYLFNAGKAYIASQNVSETQIKPSAQKALLSNLHHLLSCLK